MLEMQNFLILEFVFVGIMIVQCPFIAVASLYFCCFVQGMLNNFVHELVILMSMGF